jgi:hypothetical protein
LTLDEETKSIRDVLKEGRLHLRFTDEGEERTLTAQQREAEGLECSQRESAARPVPAENDSEDEASFPNLLPPKGSGPLGKAFGPGVAALSKYTGVGTPPEKALRRRNKSDSEGQGSAIGRPSAGKRADRDLPDSPARCHSVLRP